MSWKPKRKEPDGLVRDKRTGVGYTPEALEASREQTEEALRRAREKGREESKGRTAPPRRSSRRVRAT